MDYNLETAIKKKEVFQFSELAKEKISLCIRFVCMFLFLYTAYAKIIDHERFLSGLEKVTIISGSAVYISWLVPFTEILISILLLVPQTAKWGLYSFSSLMLSFTGYIISALLWEKDLPCHCGGAIEKLSWGQHI